MKTRWLIEEEYPNIFSALENPSKHKDDSGSLFSFLLHHGSTNPNAWLVDLLQGLSKDCEQSLPRQTRSSILLGEN